MHLAGVIAAGDPWVRWDWVADHGDVITAALREHIVLTVEAVLLGLIVAIPVSLAAVRWRWLQAPAFSIAGILYTIPSLALFAILVPLTGLSRTTALIPLASYTLFILTRNIVTGLEGVPSAVKDAADGMGYGSTARLVKVELPLAFPSIMAGIRLATISTIGLVTVTALIGLGGLGQLINDGLQRDFRTPLVVGSVLSVLLAVVADVLLLGVQRIATPWTRAAD